MPDQPETHSSASGWKATTGSSAERHERITRLHSRFVADGKHLAKAGEVLIRLHARRTKSPTAPVFSAASCSRCEAVMGRRTSSETTAPKPPNESASSYLDVTENLKGMEIATEIAMEIRAKIKAATGLNASGGISYNKFLAKMASDLNKPNGQADVSFKVC
jgi:nucleotidyltransferase/DNA polymerase involved in DNA repair